MKEESISVSVVIPTLGGSTLVPTIEQLRNGKLVPNEILVCIPEEYAENLNGIEFDNVRFIYTPFKGQVSQRASGFMAAKGNIVVQMDDDIRLDTNCLNFLVETLKEKGNGCSAGPVMLDAQTGKSIYELDMSPWKKKLYYWLANGKDGNRPGAIANSGISLGFTCDVTERKRYPVEWLPGGCIAHFKENLVLEDYYPYKGKAYGEDILHSLILRQKKSVQLFVDSGAKCFLDMQADRRQRSRLGIREYIAEYNARRYTTKMSNKSIARLNIFYAFWIINIMVRRIVAGIGLSPSNRERLT